MKIYKTIIDSDCGCPKFEADNIEPHWATAFTGGTILSGPGWGCYSWNSNNDHLETIRRDIIWLSVTDEISLFSSCERKKVGSLIVKNRTIQAEGYNGTPRGAQNCCENDRGETKSTVIHAEENAIKKAISNGIDIKDSTIYINLSPCENCIKLCSDRGIKKIVFNKIHSSFQNIITSKLYNDIELCYYKIFDKNISTKRI